MAVKMIGLAMLATLALLTSAETEEFNAKPNGTKQTASISTTKPDGTEMHCHVAYAVVGGTNEQWLLSLEPQGDHYECSIFRPEQTSYLYFMYVEVEIENAGDIVSVTTYDNKGEVQGAVDVTGSTVMTGDGFNHELARMEVLF
eukprot:m.9977 g.9977  ORF g.9977 m.9977 type:complete len:144 (-) comp9553_c0_seq1:187-618(-)